MGNGTTKVVTRNSTLPTSNSELPEIHTQLFGERILAWADSRFPKDWIPPSSDVSAADLIDVAEKANFILGSQNFMVSSSVEPLDGGNGVWWTLVAPANLWSTKVFRQLNYRLTNNYEV